MVVVDKYAVVSEEFELAGLNKSRRFMVCLLR
jgi:hypothetical protein